ncbi:MAG: acetate--CoA ligase family protein [Candidatus Nanoarchaeia archaeon]|nr:acetate--CoA ligase family protein [Candidatus Nanoarchaeia archaeon]
MLKLSDSLRFMKTRNFNLAEFYECSNKSELLSAFDRLTKPLVIKISSEEYSHKSDVGGLFLNINDKKELLKAYNNLKKLSKSVVLQEQKKGIELILGINNDNVFGKMIMLGIGGVFVELIKDVSFRKAPITKKDALDMINELKFKKILNGFRNNPKINIDKLSELLVKLGELAINEKVLSMDLNPVMFLENDYFLVDARIELE